MNTNITNNTTVTKKLDVAKLITYLVVPIIFLGLIVYFVFLNNSYKNLTGKFTKQVEIVNSQNLIITNISIKNSELSTLIKNYDIYILNILLFGFHCFFVGLFNSFERKLMKNIEKQTLATKPQSFYFRPSQTQM
jgi:hypothetical protein